MGQKLVIDHHHVGNYLPRTEKTACWTRTMMSEDWATCQKLVVSTVAVDSTSDWHLSFPIL